MRSVASIVARTLTVTLIVLLLFACGHGQRAAFSPQPGDVNEPAASITVAEVTWPNALPVDALQPWETLDGSGRIASSINLESEFVPGVEWFTAAGEVSDLGEASSFASGASGAGDVSYALYRLPLGTEQPGTIAADVNLYAGGAYYLGVADYSANTWRWHGPFSAPHVRVPLPHYEYTSTLGNLFIAVVAYDGAAFDLVGLGVNARDDGDTAAPDAPGAPILTPVAGGLHVRWLQVDAEDLAGYRVYAGGEEALGYVEGGETVVIPASAETEITLTSIDLSGNESEASEPSIAIPLAGAMPTIELTASTASGGRHAVIELTATGAETYDWDVDGDGDWDITGDTAGTATASTASYGLMRPALQGHTADGGFSLSAVSLLIAGNSRPVAEAFANPSYGQAPLEVSFEGFAEDDDGTIALYAWDFDGDGNYDYDHSTNPNPPPHTYSATGLYNAKFRVTDNEGAWDVDTVSVQVLPDPDNQMPVIEEITAEPSFCTPGTLVQFTATANDPDGSIAEWSWDFDSDGLEDSIEQNPSHTFATAGFYNVRLRVDDDTTGFAVGYVGVHVQGTVPNLPPTADLQADVTSGDAPLTVNFDAAGSSDPDAGDSIVRYWWDFDGNGVYEGATVVASSSYTYTGPGHHTATVLVEDTHGGTDSAAVAITAAGWVSETLDDERDTDGDTCMLIVQGNPAIVFFSDMDGKLMYMRADDPAGESWGDPVTASSGWTYQYSMAIVNGNPAIAYYDGANNGRLVYVRATDSTGSSWGPPVTVNSTDYSGPDPSLCVVDGYPAITSYQDNGPYDLLYHRATDANGNAWGAPITVDSAGYVGYDSSLLIVNGNPAISYLDNSNNKVKYIRANDTAGTTWGTPVVPDSTCDAGYYSSMTIVDGYPAISYHGGGGAELRYIRATDADGSTWGSPIDIDEYCDLDDETCLRVIGGVPAICYYDGDKITLKYVHAADSTGSAWAAPEYVTDFYAGGESCWLAEVDGAPAISYNLLYEWEDSVTWTSLAFSRWFE